MRYFIPASLALVLGLNSCTKEEAPLPSYPNEIKVNGVSFAGNVNGITAIRSGSGSGGTAIVQIATISGTSGSSQLGLFLDYSKVDDLTDTYLGHGGIDNPGNLSNVLYQEIRFNGGQIPVQKGWSLAEDEISTISMNHLGNNRYQLGFDVYMEGAFDTLPDLHITGIYTANFTAEFN
ncbi:hypothetical protein GC167_06430 [bacterium]|nr:hypothetical protein [bacterium]